MEFSEKAHNFLFHKFLSKLPKNDGEPIWTKSLVPIQLTQGRENPLFTESFLQPSNIFIPNSFKVQSYQARASISYLRQQILESPSHPLLNLILLVTPHSC